MSGFFDWLSLTEMCWWQVIDFDRFDHQHPIVDNCHTSRTVLVPQLLNDDTKTSFILDGSKIALSE